MIEDHELKAHDQAKERIAALEARCDYLQGQISTLQRLASKLAERMTAQDELIAKAAEKKP